MQESTSSGSHSGLSSAEVALRRAQFGPNVLPAEKGISVWTILLGQIVTVILVIGMRKILRRQGLVKQMLTVETLGSVTVICTDKTGTLTEGRMRVTHTALVDPERALQTMALCNNMEGPVDVALWEYAQTQPAADPQAMVDASTRVAEELFSSETKFMSTATRLGSEFNDYLKGAPEIVLGMCADDGGREAIPAQADAWASEGHRLLGLAYRPHNDLETHTGYTWLGLVAMEDPLTLAIAFLVPGLRQALGLVPLNGAEWALVFAIALALLAVVEAAKWINNRLQPSLQGAHPQHI